MTIWTEPVRLGTVATLPTNGPGTKPLTPTTLDGVSVLPADVILVKDQRNPVVNGLWVADATPGVAMERKTGNPGASFDADCVIPVLLGTRNAHTLWRLIAPPGAITVGADALPWIRQDVRHYSCETIAELRTLTGVLVGATATVASYAEDGDAGGGDFRFVGVPDKLKIDTTAAGSVAITSVDEDLLIAGRITLTAVGHGLGAGGNVASVHLADITNVDDGPYLVEVIDVDTLLIKQRLPGAAAGVTPTLSYVSCTTVDPHGRGPGQAAEIRGVTPDAGEADVLGITYLTGIIDDSTISLPVDTPAGTYTIGANAALGDGGIRVLAMDDAGAIGGVWERTTQLPVSPKWWGAVGKGDATDDTSPINAAIASANSAVSPTGDRGTVVLPLGSYLVTKQLLTLAPGVTFRGNGMSNTTGSVGSVIRSEVVDTLLYLAENDDANAAVNVVVQDIGFFNKTDSDPADFDVDAGACIETRGGAACLVQRCSIVGYPIGIVVDGAYGCTVDQCNIQNADDGFQDAHTLGRGVWLVDGGERGRGNTDGGSANACVFNAITRCLPGGNFNDVLITGGIGNLVQNCVFQSTDEIEGGAAMHIAGGRLTTLRAVVTERYNGAGTVGVRLTASSFQVRIEDSYLRGSSAIAKDIEGGATSQLTLSNCELSSADNTPAIVTIGAGVALNNVTALGNWASSPGSVLADQEPSGGVSMNKDTSTGAGAFLGIGIGKLNPAEAIVDGVIVEQESPLLQIGDPGAPRLRLWSEGPERHKAERLLVNGAAQAARVDLDEVVLVADADPPVANNACACPLAPNSILTATWHVTQWNAADFTHYGSWIRSQIVSCDDMGVIDIKGAPIDQVAVEVDPGDFVPPTLADDGAGNLVVQVWSHEVDSGRAKVRLHLEVAGPA